MLPRRRTRKKIRRISLCAPVRKSAIAIRPGLAITSPAAPRAARAGSWRMSGMEFVVKRTDARCVPPLMTGTCIISDTRACGHEPKKKAGSPG